VKKKLVKTLLIVTCLLTVFVAGGTYALAHPTYDQECNVCHTNEDVLTLTSNATGTVDAKVGVPFLLVLNAGSGAEAMKIVSTWANNDQFTFSETLVEDGQTGDTNSASGEITADVTITPIAAGSYTIRVWTAAGPGLLSKSLDVAVDVAQNTETTLPTTTTTQTTSTGTTGNTIEQWTFDLISFNVIAAVVLLVLGVVICKRTGRQ
jgi:hypothetical protein